MIQKNNFQNREKRFLYGLLILSISLVLINGCKKAIEIEKCDEMLQKNLFKDNVTKNNCYQKAFNAFQAKDFNFKKCDEISDEDSKSFCYGMSIKNLDELANCYKLTMDDECITWAISKLMTADQLDQISKEKPENKYSKEGLLNICNNLKKQSVRDDCYLDIAVYLKDNSICEKIIKQGLKELCLK